MTTQAPVPVVDTNIIPDRNCGMGSLLWDLQNPRDPGLDGPPPLGRRFAFIDVGVSRAKASIALRTLLSSDLGMDVDYVATERVQAVPSATVVPLGDGAEVIRGCLSELISSGGVAREVTDWHYVIDRERKVSSVAYSYSLQGNEIWESYFMGRAFLVSGQRVQFRAPKLDEMLAADVARIEANAALEGEGGGDAGWPGPLWSGYVLERRPLEAGLASHGIALQATDVPLRINDRQNVLFLGNVVNQYPRDERARALDTIAANMEEGDLVVVQVDDVASSFVEVLRVRGQGATRARERVRWIDTRRLEVQKPGRVPGSWRQVRLKPALDAAVGRLVRGLGTRVSGADRDQVSRDALMHRSISRLFGFFFRALPVDETLRIAVREAMRRLPIDGGQGPAAGAEPSMRGAAHD